MPEHWNNKDKFSQGSILILLLFRIFIVFKFNVCQSRYFEQQFYRNSVFLKIIIGHFKGFYY